MSDPSRDCREDASPITGDKRTGAGVALSNTAAQAHRWLFEAALPIWASVGHDALEGGFFEQIDLASGAPLLLPKRCRVQARQSYVFAEAGRLGWDGPWRERARSGRDFMVKNHLRGDGLMRFTTQRNGAPHDDSVDNYDQAFALFGLAHVQGFDADGARIAHDLLAALRRDRAHALGGFHEKTPGPAPLLANPHMHFFEAALAWLDVAPDPVWRDFADEMATLCLTQFIDPDSGALREYFDADWTPGAGEAGRIVEPGHQFEWAWLLLRWRAHGGAVDLSVPRRLYDFADTYGLDRRESLVVNEALLDGSVRDPGARLWPQAERMKAAIRLAGLSAQERGRFEADAQDAWRGMQHFIDSRDPGLFRDKRRPDGRFAPEGALASSLYHIVGAVCELVRYAETAA